MSCEAPLLEEKVETFFETQNAVRHSSRTLQSPILQLDPFASARLGVSSSPADQALKA